MSYWPRRRRRGRGEKRNEITPVLAESRSLNTRRKSKLRSLNVFDEFDGSSSKIDGLISSKNKAGIIFFFLMNSGFDWLTSVQFSHSSL